MSGSLWTRTPRVLKESLFFSQDSGPFREVVHLADLSLESRGPGTDPFRVSGQKWGKWNFGPFSHFPRHVSPISQVRPKSIFRPCSSPGPNWICTNLNPQDSNWICTKSAGFQRQIATHCPKNHIVGCLGGDHALVVASYVTCKRRVNRQRSGVKFPWNCPFFTRFWREILPTVSEVHKHSPGSLPPKNLGNSRRDPLRGKFPRRASRRVVPLGW